MLRDAGLRLLVLVVGSTVQHASADAVLDGFRTLDYKASSFQKAQVRFSSMRQTPVGCGSVILLLVQFSLTSARAAVAQTCKLELPEANIVSLQCLELTCSLHGDPWQRGCGQAHTCEPGRDCLSTSKAFLHLGENIELGWTTIQPAGTMDMITIESADGTGECLLSRYTDGRIPSPDTTTEPETLRSHDASFGTVTFDAATSPLQPGEYMAKLHSSSERTAVEATTYFVIMEPYDLASCEACHAATPCMPSWGRGGALEYACGVCPTGFDSSLCIEADCPECTGASAASRCLASQPPWHDSHHLLRTCCS
jgi:hypothetical protein